MNLLYINEIQHVRRRETIAMTPANTLVVLQKLIKKSFDNFNNNNKTNKDSVLNSIRSIEGNIKCSY